MAKDKVNEFGESLEVTKEQEAIGVSIINGRRCLHGLNFDQVDEMNDLSLGLDAYKEYIKQPKVVEESAPEELKKKAKT